MLSYKTSKKHIRLIWFAIISVFMFLTAVVYAQEIDTAQQTLIDVPMDDPLVDTVAEASLAQGYQIMAVNYKIKGLTRKYPLSQAVPIDTGRIFDSKEAMLQYLGLIEQQFKNIRVIQSVQIDTEYGTPNNESVIPVTLTITIIDTWNFIVVPYPSFDSNSGFQLKQKMQDFNF